MLGEAFSYGEFLIRLVTSILLFTVAISVLNLLITLLDFIQPFGDSKKSNDLKKNILYVLSTLYSFYLIQTHLGLNSFQFFVIFVCLGYLTDLVVRKALKNIYYGLSIKILRLYKKDDLLMIDGYSGRVKSFNLMMTKIIDYKGDIIMIPNQNTLYPKVVNYSKLHIDKLVILVKFNATVNIQEVKKHLLKKIQKNGNILNKPMPEVQIMSYENYHILSLETWVLEEFSNQVYNENVDDIKVIFQEFQSDNKFPGRTFEIIKN
ncbi:mechanosensitive ion channel family protein [Aquimarina latercula]|uniref:mechanosensitive ion channel family protein n=1 Tax=Aquimarina latercula TaxID=987 RepID=UPI0003FA4C64|nr:mechanosensitive ion channel family protein [Aquimarina latercula]